MLFQMTLFSFMAEWYFIMHIYNILLIYNIYIILINININL